jgi:hypothetical protein
MRAQCPDVPYAVGQRAATVIGQQCEPRGQSLLRSTYGYQMADMPGFGFVGFAGERLSGRPVCVTKSAAPTHVFFDLAQGSSFYSQATFGP